MTINLTDPANQLTEELQLTPERLADIAEDGYIVDGEAQEMARRLLAAEAELQERRKADQPTDDERIMAIEGIAPPAPQLSRMSRIMPDYEGVAMTQRECYMAGKKAGLAEAALKHQSNNFTDEDLEGMIHGNNPVANAYRELLAFRRNSDGWIPVSERMPEVGEYVLCLDGLDRHGQFAHDDVYTAAYCDRLGSFTTEYYGDHDWMSKSNPMYWSPIPRMPLPAAPQEVKDE